MVIALLTAGSKGPLCFGKKGVPSCFFQLISELKRSFERASDTQALQKFTGITFDPFLRGFPTAVRAEPGRAEETTLGLPGRFLFNSTFKLWSGCRALCLLQVG